MNVRHADGLPKQSARAPARQAFGSDGPRLMTGRLAQPHAQVPSDAGSAVKVVLGPPPLEPLSWSKEIQSGGSVHIKPPFTTFRAQSRCAFPQLDIRELSPRYRQDSCALSDSPIGPPSGAATLPAASRPGSGGRPTRSPRRTPASRSRA